MVSDGFLRAQVVVIAKKCWVQQWKIYRCSSSKWYTNKSNTHHWRECENPRFSENPIHGNRQQTPWKSQGDFLWWFFLDLKVAELWPMGSHERIIHDHPAWWFPRTVMEISGEQTIASPQKALQKIHSHGAMDKKSPFFFLVGGEWWPCFEFSHILGC